MAPRLILTAAATLGSETIGFVSSPAGYTVTYTAPGGAATGDAVDAAAATGSTVTLTLAKALATGDSVDIAAPGMNPAPTALTQADDITVQAGSATAERTNSIEFGNSVTGVIVTPSLPVVDALTTYTIEFHASDATAMGSDIYLSESAGPTNFTTVTSIEVIDSTQNWHFLATGAVLAQGTATIPLLDAVDAGDSLSVIVDDVDNPPAAGTIDDFTVATTSDPVAASAARYTIVANASPGVVVTVNPDTTGSVAVYTISNIHASAALTGGDEHDQAPGPERDGLSEQSRLLPHRGRDDPLR